MRQTAFGPHCGALVAIVLGAAAAPNPALASLGGPAASVSADQARMHVANHTVANAANETVHTMTLADGNIVREHVNAGGTVFAVAWKGRGRPDMAQLLGPHYTAFQANAAGARRHLRRMPPVVDRGDLKIVTGGHPGAFWGVAWLPQAAPAGFIPTTP